MRRGEAGMTALKARLRAVLRGKCCPMTPRRPEAGERDLNKACFTSVKIDKEALLFGRFCVYSGASQGLSGHEPACQCRRHGFNPWVRKIPWRQEWLLTPGFLLGDFHGWSLASSSSWDCKRVRYNLATKPQQQHALWALFHIVITSVL